MTMMHVYLYGTCTELVVVVLTFLHLIQPN